MQLHSVRSRSPKTLRENSQERWSTRTRVSCLRALVGLQRLSETTEDCQAKEVPALLGRGRGGRSMTGAAQHPPSATHACVLTHCLPTHCLPHVRRLLSLHPATHIASSVPARSPPWPLEGWLVSSKGENGPEPQAKPVSQAVVQHPRPTRMDVLWACGKSTLWITACGAALRLSAPSIAEWIPGAERIKVERLIANDLAVWHGILAFILAAGVTSTRLVLLKAWPAFAEATNRSNELVLRSVSGVDLIYLSFLPGFSEELLFNGGLVPALGAGWKGLGVSGCIFGSLHVGGGRSWAFAAWATAVSWLYGAAYLYTHDLLVPVVAHSLANVASAVLWRSADNQAAKGKLDSIR